MTYNVFGGTLNPAQLNLGKLLTRMCLFTKQVPAYGQ